MYLVHRKEIFIGERTEIHEDLVCALLTSCHFTILRADMMVNPTFNWNPGCEVVVLVEEYIDGDEFDVDVLMWQGNPVYANVVDNVWACLCY